MANTLLTIDQITREALRLAHEKSAFIGTVNRQFDSSWSSDGPTGDTLRIRIPSQYTRRKGSRVMAVQDSVQISTSLVRATQDGVDMRFNSRELALDIDRFSELHLAPAMATMISGIESDMFASLTKQVWNVAGTAGTAPNDLAAVGAARAKLNQGLAPKDGNRYIQMDSVTMGSLVNGLKGLFQDSSQIKEQYREGMVGRTAMADFYENERIRTMSNMTSVNISSAKLSTFTITDGATAISTQNFDVSVAAGQVFTIAGIYAAHPETKAAYASLQQFTVVSGTSVYVSFQPPIYLSNANQNVAQQNGQVLSTLLLTSAALTFVGVQGTSYVQNLMYHRDAFTFATAELPLMGKSEKCVRKTFDGISLRLWQDSDIRNDELLTRIDILYGFAAIRPQWACRITS